MAFCVIVMVTLYGFLFYFSGEKSDGGSVCTACIAGVNLNTVGGKRILRPFADTAADDCLRAVFSQNIGKRTVSLSVIAFYFSGYDITLLICRIILKRGGFAEMLKNYSVLISDCNFHFVIPFPQQFFIRKTKLFCAVAGVGGVQNYFDNSITHMVKFEKRYDDKIIQEYRSL